MSTARLERSNSLLRQSPWLFQFIKERLFAKGGATIAGVLLAEPTVVITIFQMQQTRFTERSNSMLRQPPVDTSVESNRHNMSMCSGHLSYRGQASGRNRTGNPMHHLRSNMLLQHFYINIRMVRQSQRPKKSNCISN